MAFDALVLAGGRSSRMQGPDKLDADIGGTALLQRVIGSCSQARSVIAVGPRRPALAGVSLWVREQPPGGGPVAAIAAGLDEVREDIVVVLAGDLPFTTGVPEHLVDLLVDGDGEGPADGVVPVDGEGRRQGLCAAYRVTALRTALASIAVEDAPVWRLLDALRLRELATLPPDWFRDVDTPEDLAAVRQALATQEQS